MTEESGLPALPPGRFGKDSLFYADQMREYALAERARCAMIAWQEGGNRCDVLVQRITGEPLDVWLAAIRAVTDQQEKT